MAASTMTHIICTGALITLILVMPLFFYYVIDNINVEMKERELKEVADYVSNSLGNLYLLANSTNRDVLLKKTLDLPSSIRDSTYYVEIAYDQNGSAQYVKASLTDSSGMRARAYSLILPGPKTAGSVIESGEKTVVAGCVRNGTGTYVWIQED